MSLDSFKVKNIIKQALIEDIEHGDLTTNALIPPEHTLTASFNSREDGVMAGLPLVSLIYHTLDPNIKVEPHVKEGEKIKAGQKLVTISGNARAILTGERLTLNFIQRTCAIATETDKFQEAIKPYKARVCSTRKTSPNFRIFSKYSVDIGGGSPHRFGLFDAVMIKDNHIAVAGSITKAVEIVKQKIPHTMKIEVETENLDQVKEALEANIDIIMLDNMSVDMMKEAVKMIDGKVVTEASGVVTLDNVNKIASSGVDYISTSAITAKAGILDIGLDV